MRLIKYAILGALGVYGFKYATQKRSVDGKSLIDDLTDAIPDIINKIRNYGEKIRKDYNQTTELY
ncbi:YtxH domain-containing protein [Pedobacter chinensis]|uniref:YtxH domain-containing protein n=1 Tax=Pedobacter chinensis TaxID=2282421 RepID=A0A369PZ13_9SPHI|nr:YtxH domain-containing protein [Pedobacter chinensis]RDC57482.1 YtxH domain-containing protein [Pedobacter chinensis]